MASLREEQTHTRDCNSPKPLVSITSSPEGRSKRKHTSLSFSTAPTYPTAPREREGHCKTKHRRHRSKRRQRSALVCEWEVSTKHLALEEISRSPHPGGDAGVTVSRPQQTQFRGAKTPSPDGFKTCSSQTSRQRSPSQQQELHLR